MFAQTFPDFEILVTNDASPDTLALETVLARYTDPRLRYLKTDVNKGISGARNTCIRAARGEFIAFLDGDDKWKPEYLERMSGIMRADPGLSVLYSDCVVFGSTPFAGRTQMEHMAFGPSGDTRGLAGRTSKADGFGCNGAPAGGARGRNV